MDAIKNVHQFNKTKLSLRYVALHYGIRYAILATDCVT